MEKIKAFSNAREFQQFFGITEHDNGVKSRRNKILLQFYKSPTMWEYCRKKGYRRGFDRYFSIKTMADLKTLLIYDIKRELERSASNSCTERWYGVCLMDDVFWSRKYSTDNCYGIPSNREIGFVRYVTHEENRNGKVYRMRAGKFYKRLLLESELGRALPEAVLNWLCEQFTESWSSYVVRQLPHYTLHVDDDFRRIYSYGFIGGDKYGCTTDFGSCMMDDDQYIFYEHSVKAKAAYLLNDSNRVIARCVIFTDVHDEDGNKWRLAERQYAEYGRDLYKRCLVDSLIEGGYIDGYKQVGVDCHQTTSYVDNEGNSLSDKQFHLDCKLNFSEDCDDAWENKEDGRILSYQDSFKFFDYKNGIAYNTKPDGIKGVLELDTTNCYLEGSWDEYHSRWCVQTRWVWVKGRDITCDVDDLDQDFIYVGNSYIHKDDFVECPVCGNMMPDHKLYDGREFTYYFNESGNRTYVCSYDCRRKLEKEYESKCFFDVLSCEYVRKDKATPVIVLHIFAGNVDTFICSSEKMKERIADGTISIVKDSTGAVVPVYATSRHLQERYDEYFFKYPLSMRKAINKVVFENRANNVESLYNPIEVEQTI